MAGPSLSSTSPSANAVQEVALRLQAQAAEQANKANADFLIKVQTGAYSAATAYSSALVAGGYVVFFTAWANSKQFVPDWAILTTFVMMAVSAMLFVGFQIYNMLEQQFLSLGLGKIMKASNGNIGRAILTYQQHAETMMRRVYRIWVFVFPATVLTGYGAVILLAFFFIRALIHPLPGIAE